MVPIIFQQRNAIALLEVAVFQGSEGNGDGYCSGSRKRKRLALSGNK